MKEKLIEMADKAIKYDELLKLQGFGELCCSFCNRSQSHVDKFIASGNNTYICNRCVEISVELLNDGSNNI